MSAKTNLFPYVMLMILASLGGILLGNSIQQKWTADLENGSIWVSMIVGLTVGILSLIMVFHIGFCARDAIMV